MTFASHRTNMVETQLTPNGIRDPELINLFQTLPREHFYAHSPDAGASYCDTSIETAKNRYSLPPITEARMLYNAHLSPEDAVLVIGANSPSFVGYLSNFVSSVVVIDTDQSLLDSLSEQCQKLEIYNVTCDVVKDMTSGHARLAPFSKMFFAGAVYSLPPILRKQVLDNGAIFAIHKSSHSCPGELLAHAIENGKILSSTFISNENADYLIGFAPAEHFTF